LSSQLIKEFLVILPVLLVSLVAHELAHAAVATALGDPTPRATGRMTLNPLAHLELFGTLMLVLTFFVSQGSFFFGWAKPVQIDPRYLDRRWGSQALVAAAGPFTNLVLAAICGLLVKVFESSSAFAANAFYTAFMLNMVLAVLNILPVPPLDGWRVVTGLLPVDVRVATTDRLAPYESYVFIVLFFVLWRFPAVFQAIFVPPMQWMAGILGI
jgi:Zn-dependent protease